MSARPSILALAAAALLASTALVRANEPSYGPNTYDRTLEALRAGKKVFVLGLAYSGQEIEAAPMESHDQKLDAILTETGYIEVEKT